MSAKYNDAFSQCIVENFDFPHLYFRLNMSVGMKALLTMYIAGMRCWPRLHW